MIGEVIAGVVGKVIDRAWPLLELEKLKIDRLFS